MDGSVFIPLVPGACVRSAGRTWRITRDLTLDVVLAEDVETGETRRLRVDQIETTTREGWVADVGALEKLPDEDWATAQKRFQAIEPLVNRRDRRRGEVEQAAAAAGVTPATVYSWIGRFERSGHLSSLLPRKGGRRTGARQLSAEMEEIIRQHIEDEYLHKQQKVASDVFDAVKGYCDTQKLKPPGENTVRRRIMEVDQAYKLRRRGMRDEARKLEPLRGTYPKTTHPLEVVQIDHTPADLMVVTDDRLHSLGRPWITLAIDVYTRMVVGYWLDIERPTAGSVGMCICMAVLPKRDILAALELPGEWPVWGKPGKIHADNAREFDCRTVERACAQHQIGLEFRPPATPHWGGHIERLCGTVNKRTHKLPGTTFSNPVERGKYKSEKEAVLTLDEFERWLINHIVNVYNTGMHEGVGMAPLGKWREAILGTPSTPARGMPSLFANPESLRIDFLPYEELTVQRYGIQWDHMRYHAPTLNRWIGTMKPGTKRSRRFTVRRDPRKNSPVWFEDPELKRYFPIPFADPTTPVMSVWEQRTIMRQLKANGEKQIDQAKIVEAHKLGQRIVEGARTKTMAARKAEHRRRRTERAVAQGPADPPNLRAPTPRPDPALEEDIYSQAIPMPEIIDVEDYG